MPPARYTSISALEENSPEVYNESTEVLIRIARNILAEPSNPKYRSISLASNVVTNKLLPASGAMECLFEMGFQEGTHKLVLPQGVSLDSIRHIHDELIKRKSLQSKTLAEKTVESIKENPTSLLLRQDLIALSSETTHSFLKKMIFWCFCVLKYESEELQLKALRLVPLTELNLNVMKNIRKIQMEYKKKNIKEEAIDYQEMLLIELCNWFNTEFFSWVDCPQCTKCGCSESAFAGMSEKKFPGADRVEEYKCKKCNEKILFVRYNDPNKLLETRKGRCGEWANCFCLLTRALGWDSRLVFDETDHVWVEVYSLINSRWVHCDPCENAVDTPLIYECGWKKKLSYVIAYSKDEIQDVTWRYSCNYTDVLRNRKKCSEKDLVDFIIKVRNIMLNHTSPARRDYVIKRTLMELVEFMKKKSPSDADGMGRISGSLAWRLLRGETSIDSDFKPYVWTVSDEDRVKKKFSLSYITAKDEYFKNSKCVMKNWKNGLYAYKSVFRKEEKDWKMTYLARTECSDRGVVTWKFDTGEKCSIGTIELRLIRQTFETGIISCKLCSEDSCVLVPNDKDYFLTDAFMGSKTVELIIELFGGSGSNAWQHAQILRQPISSTEPSFNFNINLVQI